MPAEHHANHGHDHHAHDRHGHEHSAHDHRAHRDHAPGHGTRDAWPRLDLLQWSLAMRLGLALALSAVMWAAVAAVIAT